MSNQKGCRASPAPSRPLLRQGEALTPWLSPLPLASWQTAGPPRETTWPLKNHEGERLQLWRGSRTRGVAGPGRGHARACRAAPFGA